MSQSEVRDLLIHAAYLCRHVNATLSRAEPIGPRLQALMAQFTAEAAAEIEAAMEAAVPDKPVVTIDMD